MVILLKSTSFLQLSFCSNKRTKINKIEFKAVQTDLIVLKSVDLCQFLLAKGDMKLFTIKKCLVYLF